MRTRNRQGLLEFRGRGGKRPGAGRKCAEGKKPGVTHHGRAKHDARHPVHVTLRLVAGLPNVREKEIYLAVEDAVRAGSNRFGFRAVEFSVLSNHMHFLAEAESTRALSRGVQGLKIRIAKAINRVLGRTGKVFADRYHARELRTPTEVRNCLVYILNNEKHHWKAPAAHWAKRVVDPCSSAKWFDGWDGPIECQRISEVRPGARPETWLLKSGWKRLGLLSPQEVPRSSASLETGR